MNAPIPKLADVLELAQNLVRNGGITKDQAKHALDVINPQLVELGRFVEALDPRRHPNLLSALDQFAGRTCSDCPIPELRMAIEEDGDSPQTATDAEIDGALKLMGDRP